ncbi:MAG: YraN family protein [Patescibacteria group bacterium]|nr:YraN family protein [Patescibacteria group bacterium]
MGHYNINVGKIGEDLACKHLTKNGYKIIERNFKKGYGELDIIAVDKNELVFIEVKARKSMNFGGPFEAITPYKLRTLIKTAEYYKWTHKNLPDQMRMDAIGITLDVVGSITELEHIKNISGF